MQDRSDQGPLENAGQIVTAAANQGEQSQHGGRGTDDRDGNRIEQIDSHAGREQNARDQRERNSDNQRDDQQRFHLFPINAADMFALRLIGFERFFDKQIQPGGKSQSTADQHAPGAAVVFSVEPV